MAEEHSVWSRVQNASKLMNVLVTGSAGFIGYHTCKHLLDKKIKVYGLDNINSYYDINIKKNRLKDLKKYPKFKFSKINICNYDKLNKFFLSNKIDYVIHLAAQAGVRYSIDKPREYFESNLLGFFNVMECCVHNKIKHFIFASTSSVYGEKHQFPIKENYNTDKPLSFYAATKKSNEVLAYSYSNIYNLKCTALRFFTVYGPFGRPDMALFKFVKSILGGNKIDLYNKGIHERDFTYISDVTEPIYRLIRKPSMEKIPFQVFNVASNKPNTLKKYILLIENHLGKKSKINNKGLQKGDVIKTHGSVSKLNKYISYKSKYNLNTGIKNFISWYKKYYSRH